MTYPKNPPNPRTAKFQDGSYREANWFDTEKMVPVYGIQRKHKGAWINVASGGQAVLFYNETDRDIFINELKSNK